ncbi:MAG: DUF2846 domain-containing protein [Flavobacteriaceae bacterium]|nr:DUF2846 domain-containing protein [Flavobacteriaceae bacterium]
MKVSLKTIILLIAIFLTGSGAFIFAQDIPENIADADFGLVYFIRGKGFSGSATSFSAIIDDVNVCNLNNRSYSVHQVTPGLHQFKAQFGGKKGKSKAEILEINVEPGKTYYVQMLMQMSFWVNDLTSQEITRNSALGLIKEDEIKLDEKCE